MYEYENYPVLEIHLNRIRENAEAVVNLCKEKGISVTGVVKGTDSYENSYLQIVNQYLEAGCEMIGDSRLNTIRRMRERGVTAPVLLIRIPMLSELKDVVQYTQTSLQSELGTILALNAEAEKQDKTHSVVLMADMGDLREGFFDKEELVEVAIKIEKELKNVHLAGVGTNLGCYGSIKPDVKNLSDLIQIAESIEGKIGRKLEIISGGATSTLPMVVDGTVPERINHLRIGEGIVIAKDLPDIWEVDMPVPHKNTYIVKAQVIEVKDKPSYPIGEIFIDAFGNTPEYEDRGTRKRALVAIGKRDVGDVHSLVPLISGITIEGGSSDHLILDVTDAETEVSLGDILTFECYYPVMINATQSSSVTKVYKGI